jgi:hypothetical protein
MRSLTLLPISHSFWTLLLLMPVLFSCSSSAPKLTNDLSLNNLKGPISLLTVQSYKALEKFGEVQQGAIRDAETLHYDEKGFLLEHEKLLSYTTYKYVYTNDNQPREKTIYNRTADLVGKEVYTYDKNGNRTEESVYGADSTLYVKNVLRYNSQGNMLEKSSYDETGALLSRFTYEYNSDDNLLQYKGYRPDGQLMSRFSYHYDENGNVIQEDQLVRNGGDSSFAATTLYYQYTDMDKQGNWTRQVVLNETRTPTLVKTRDFEYY